MVELAAVDEVGVKGCDGVSIVAELAARDGRRVHLVPGQRLPLNLPDPGADAYIIESAGGTATSRSL